MNDNQNRLVRAITKDRQIRVLTARTTELVEEARKLHKTSPLATAALGRTLTGALLVASLLKSGHEVSLSVDGDGPLGKIVAEANYKGEVRGYLKNPDAHIPLKDGKLDVAGGVGQGELTVRKMLANGKPYEGSTKLISGEIGEDLTYYFTVSEQIPSSVGLGVLVDKDLSVRAAGGFLLQVMPDANDDDIDLLEENIANIGSLSRHIGEGKGPEEILDLVMGDIYYRILEKTDVQYHCRCSEERITSLVKSLSREEIDSVLEELGEIEIQCHFCNQAYSFDENEINDIMNKES